MMRVRQLNPGSAWNEAERRAIPLAFVGFFLSEGLRISGYSPSIGDPFLAGICGAIGLFLAGIAFVVGFYRHKLAFAIIAPPVVATVPAVVTARMLPLIGEGKVAYVASIAVGMALYLGLHRVHYALSGLPLISYFSQLAYDKHGTPKLGWEQKVFWLFVVLGAVTILSLLAKK